MTETSHSPVSLRVAALVIIAETLALSVLETSAPLRLIPVAIAVALAWFLVRGSRVAWILAVLGASTQLAGPFLMDQPMWVIATAGFALLSLLVTPSRRYVWKERRRLQPDRSKSHIQRWYARLSELPYRILEVAEAGVSRKLILRTVLVVCVLLLVDGAMYNWHEGAGQDNAVVAVLWRVVFIVTGLAQLVLLALLGLAASGYIRSKLSDWQARRA